MPRYRILIVFVGAWVSLWAAGSATAQIPAGMEEAHSTVRRLVESESRNAAFAEILSWPKNLFQTTHYRPLDLDVVDVVVCPQRDEPPLYAVLTNPESSGKRITLLDQDGTVLPLHPDGKGIRYHLGDVNGDGVVEMVGTQPIWLTVKNEDVAIEVLFVLPLTRERQPLLMVLMNAKFEQRSSFPRWTWRFRATATPGVPAIELGPRIPGEEEIETQAVYDWSADRGQYVGPPGDSILPFQRVEGTESEKVRFFAREAYERGRWEAQAASVAQQAPQLTVEVTKGPTEDPSARRGEAEASPVARQPPPLMLSGIGDHADIRGDIRPPMKIESPQPRYTEQARKARVQGVVIVKVLIDKGGNVTIVKVLKGLSLGLTEAALEAMSKWKFEPATLNGEPVDVYYNLTVSFRLQ